MKRRTSVVTWGIAVAAVALAGCDLGTEPGRGLDPSALAGSYSWVFQQWEQGGDPRGYPVVELTWELPNRWDGEAFRVYARRAGSGGYGLVATVTSCAEEICRYADTNVTPGRSYEYYVVSLDERDGDEVGTTSEVRVDLPSLPALAIPGTPTAVGLDRAVFLRWTATDAQRYMILARREGGAGFLIGETDGASFFDDRAENGVRYEYQVAAVDEEGHVSALSQAAVAVPRPDYHAERIFAHADLPGSSGFRFMANETDDPIVGGASTTAQWRLDAVAGELRIQPLGQTRVTGGISTSQLSCGPGSDSNCTDLRTAPAEGAFGATAVTVETGHTYFFRVLAEGRVHYAKVRVQGSAVNAQGQRLVVFDWAYQVRPDEPQLNVVPG